MYHVMAYWRLSDGLFHFCRNLFGICHLIPSRQNGHPKSPSFWHCCRHYIYIIPDVYILWHVCRYDGCHDWRFHHIHHIVRNQTYLWLQKATTQRIEDGLDQRSAKIILIETATVSCNKVVSAVTVGQVTWSLQLKSRLNPNLHTTLWISELGSQWFSKCLAVQSDYQKRNVS